ncbi:MAG: RDD family protein [Thiomicrospira sp.]|nr:RDD family protein [Thiomicrospira sp.]NCN66341.1 RDD family protein [Thiomicrospira sp.]NCO14795.1 RDD family protein [Thiomicrospira sp.]NCO82391.1 RDD family protein [Thiomicrospira sp.]OIP95480.1 MAG: hypothetical protein AUK56_05415 [Thiomicrospira sp. CG2_30_44_34]
MLEENVPAGFWIRTLAVILDNTFFLGGMVLSVAIINLFYTIDTESITVTLMGLSQHPDYDPRYLLINFMFLAPVYFLWSRFQATPGKTILGIKIIDCHSGIAPSKKQVFIRLLGYIVSSLPLGLGFLWVAIHPQKRGWHDLMAGTKVIYSQTETIILKGR